MNIWTTSKSNNRSFKTTTPLFHLFFLLFSKLLSHEFLPGSSLFFSFYCFWDWVVLAFQGEPEASAYAPAFMSVGILAGWGGWQNGLGQPEARKMSMSWVLPSSMRDWRNKSPSFPSGQLDQLVLQPDPEPSLWAKHCKSQAAGAGLRFPPTPPQPAPELPPGLSGPQAPGCRSMLGEDPHSCLPLPSLLQQHSALPLPVPAPLPRPVSSPCLVRNLFVSEAIAPCFVHTITLVASGFCYCRETQIYTFGKVYPKPQLLISHSPCISCIVAHY